MGEADKLRARLYEYENQLTAVRGQLATTNLDLQASLVRFIWVEGVRAPNDV